MGAEKDIAFIKTSPVQVKLADGLFASGKAPSFPDPPKEDFKIVTTQDAWNNYSSNPILFWGKDNRFPFQLDDAAKMVGILKQAMNKLVRYAYNQGVFTYIELEEPDPTTGAQKIQIVHEPAIDNFFRYSRINDYLLRCFKNSFNYGINFPLFLLDKNRKVSQLRNYESREVRLERPHPETGKAENIWVSPHWATGSLPSYTQDDIRFLRFPLLDDYNIIDQLQNMKGEFTFAQRIRNFMFSENEYGGAEWHSVYFNKWLNISANVPKLKERLFEYAMTINYMIYMDDRYWLTVYGEEFKRWDAKKKAEAVKDVQQAVERDLGGVEKSWKALFASMRYTADGKEQKTIIVEAIDNKLREGTFIPDNLHANGEILAALGIDACLLGATVLGEKISSGSGSNIREAALNLISTLRPDRDLQLEPLYTVKEINGWNPKVKFGFKDYIIGTQDGRPPVSGNETPQK